MASPLSRVNNSITDGIKMNKSHILKTFVWGSLISAIIYAYVTGEWYLFLVSLILGLAHQIFGHSVGLHRYFTHSAFKTTLFKHRLLLVWSVLCGFGDPFGYVMTHRSHHANTDTVNDPHSPMNLSFFRLLFTLEDIKDKKQRDKTISITRYFPKELTKDSWAMFIRKYYFHIWAVMILVVFLIGGLPAVLFGLGVPCIVPALAGGLVNSFGHMPKYGYRNFNTKDQSCNSILANLLSFGEGYQNNHHHRPKAANFAMAPGEFDLNWYVIKYMFMSKPD